MAGSQEFQQGVKKASQPMGGREHINSSPQLFGSTGLKGAGAWDTQMQRESQAQASSAATGSYGAKNLANYINVSKTATQGNQDFSINTGNKYVNNANTHRQTNIENNKGFAMDTTKQFVNYADQMRDSNSAKSKQFAQSTVQSYIDMNKANQSTNVAALDKHIRSQPIVDNAYGTMQGLNTYGDMYRYGREELPDWKKPEPQKPVKQPDFQGMYDQSRKDINNIKI